MRAGAFRPRFVEARLLEALSDSPVVLVHGPRQCGKTTLARTVGEPRGYSYFSFDDPVVLEAAHADPFGFVSELPEHSILDEVQKAASIFPALKSTVDRHRSPGRFLLTGSSNVLLLPQLSESLAGRMEMVRLHPFSQCELAGKPSRFLDALFGRRLKVRAAERLGADLPARIAAGGYPPALARAATRRRLAWYRDYVETLVQKDVRDLGRIRSLDALPRLLSLAAGQTARLVNVTDLAGPFQVSRPTIREYMTLLERLFLLEELPPWHTNRVSRLVKAPKLHMGDTGLTCALLGTDAPSLSADRLLLGQLLETFVFQELRRQASWQETETRFYHYRDKDGMEVDVVLERGPRELAGIEVKAGATVTAADFRGLRKLRNASGGKLAAGAVLYDGEACVGFGEGLFAVPVRFLWETA